MTSSSEHLSANISGDDSPEMQGLRAQLLSHLGITRYQLHHPDILAQEMVEAFDDVSLMSKAANANEASNTQSALVEAQPESVHKEPPPNIADLRALLNRDGDKHTTTQTSEEKSEPENSAQEQISHSSSEQEVGANESGAPVQEKTTDFSQPSDVQMDKSKADKKEAQAADATGKLVIDKSLYRALPNWLWRDMLQLLAVSEQQIMEIEPQQRLSHTQQARFILRESPQTAFYTDNMLGLDASIIAGLSAEITSDRCWQAKQQLWLLLRSTFTE